MNAKLRKTLMEEI